MISISYFSCIDLYISNKKYYMSSMLKWVIKYPQNVESYQLEGVVDVILISYFVITKFHEFMTSLFLIICKHTIRI